MRTNPVRSMLMALLVLSAAPLMAQGEPPAKLWKELDQLMPRKAGPVPVPMPSLAINWDEKITKAEELMIRSADTPVEPYAMFYLASFLFEAERYDEAKALFETIVKQKFPTHPLVTLQLSKDTKPPAVQALEDCAAEVSWHQRHPRPPMVKPELDPKIRAVIHFTTGDVKIGFYKNVTPKHFETFVRRAKAGEYDGTKIGQAVADALITCGDPVKPGVPDATPGKPTPGSVPPGIPHEYAALTHVRGVIAMSRSMAGGESSGVQFQFILKEQPYLDFSQTIFAKVVEGLEVVDAISRQGQRASTEVSIKGISFEGM